jgi:DNA modification methylase
VTFPDKVFSVFETPHVMVWQGDALEVLKCLAAESVDLCVTSPPYGDVIDYEIAASHQARGDTRKNRTGVAAEAYADWLLPRLAEVARLLRPGGVLALNIAATGPATFPEEVAFRIPRELGLRLHERVAWVKSNAAPTSNMKTHLIPSWEFVYVFTKGPGPAVFNADAIRRPYAPATVRRYGQDVHSTGDRSKMRHNRTRHSRTTVTGPLPLNPLGAHPINVLQFPPEQGSDWPHPARFPEDLPSFFIRAYTDAGGTVLDPFAGSGTTLAVARDLNRRGVGVEILPRYIEVMRGRLAQLALEVPA